MINAAILFLKDSGLRISDARLMNVGDLAEQINKGADFIAITKITQKTKLTAKTFIGPEAIQAIKKYLELRQQGSRRVPPEKITDKSPLFRTWTTGAIKRIPRGSFSSLIRSAFLRVEEPNITAHSLRKYLQTNLEAAGVNVNWIDQILGHQLINSRDAYSKPTDEQLREAYIKSYKFLKVFPEINTIKTAAKTQTDDQNKTIIETGNEEYIVETATNIQETTELIKHGFEFVQDIDGIKLYRKRK